MDIFKYFCISFYIREILMKIHTYCINENPIRMSIAICAIFIIVALLVAISIQQIDNDPFNPLSSTNGTEIGQAVLEKYPDYKQGIAEGISASNNNDNTTYQKACTYCEYTARHSHLKAFDDPSFRYYMGFIRGYEEAEMNSLKIN